MKTNTQAWGIKSWRVGLICSRSDRSPAFAISEWLCSLFFSQLYPFNVFTLLYQEHNNVCCCCWVTQCSTGAAVKRIAGVFFFFFIFLVLFFWVCTTVNSGTPKRTRMKKYYEWIMIASFIWEQSPKMSLRLLGLKVTSLLHWWITRKWSVS